MNPRPLPLLLALLATRLVAADPAPAPAVSTSAPPTRPPTRGSTSFEAFRLISERNIFDPYRTGRSNRTDEAPPRPDTVTLVGTMDYDKGPHAFFDGSAPAYRKALRTGDTIADYTVTGITHDSVELTQAGTKLTLAIGQQLRRPPGGTWSVAPADTVRREADAPPAASDSTTSPTPATPAASSDVVKRLMEQRQKQLKP
jgi:hypothetical protein